MSALERELVLLRDEVAWPPTPDLAGAVAARLASEPPRRARPRPALPLLRPATVALVALAVVAVLAATLAASPGVRARIADWLGIGAVRIERVERLPDVGPAADLGLGRRTTLAGARRAARVPVPTVAVLGAPDAVYVDTATIDRAVSVVYLARPGLPAATKGIGALLTVIPGGDVGIVKKLLGTGTTVAPIDVNGAPGVFVSGERHVIEPPNRLAGNTLLWVSDGATYRLETALGRAGALRLARSVR